MQVPDLKGVRNASDNLRDVSFVTPLNLNERLSEKLNCRYDNSGKILISDGKNLIIKHKNSDFPNFYKLKNTSFYKLLDKNYLI